ncbi:flagella basal body P-ring formation protein FlgA [Succinivibrio dextrinosolvens]|uniref:flagellar basal body P-ring formation chaperone FlgA n=1 Tax=Succinivibrio dextrinosolvens TaxID=83771 RepID=UPI0008E343E4|nr:flagellar basal body P-ring formation chaperone FlgA [Succinivibrio dextrinosolvens]SFS87409.1 flagella basal body P-ring formation protein FlgA [Succinivibrio dextrinosolvens]
MLQIIKKLSGYLGGLLLVIPLTVNASQAEADFLSNVAKQYMLAQFSDHSPDKKYVVKVSKIDPNRNFGGKCTGYLTAELQNAEIKKNNVVKITCSRKEKPYVITVPVTVSVLRASIVAASNIQRGNVITSSMVEDTYVNENTTTASVINDKNQLIGSKAKKDIRAGEQFKISDITLIAKGDIVTIEASSKNLYIKTQGIALEEGKLNDTIQVRNSKTGKIVTGIVEGPGIVRVIF